MTALGIDVGSHVTKLAWRDGGEPRTETLDVAGYEPDTLRSALGDLLARLALDSFDGVVVAVPEAWRDDATCPAPEVIDTIEALVGVRVRPVGVPVAAARELAESAPNVTRPVVVDLGAGTIEVATLAGGSRPRLVRHEFDDDRSPDGLETLFRGVCKPLLARDEPIDVAIVGGHAPDGWAWETIQRTADLAMLLQELPVSEPLTCAARGALHLAGDTGDPERTYPWPVKAWVSFRQRGHVVREERLLVEARKLEIGSLTARRLFFRDEPVRMKHRPDGVAELPRMWAETSDRCHMLLPVTVSDLPPGCVTVDLRLNRRHECSLLLRSIDDPDRDLVVLDCGVLPQPAARFPQHLKNELELIGAWGVQETRSIPQMREVVVALRREMLGAPKPKLVKRADGASRDLIDVALYEKPSTTSQAQARGIWRDRIIALWKNKVVSELEEPALPAQRDGRDKLALCQEMWKAVRRVDHHLQGLPETDWPPMLADVER